MTVFEVYPLLEHPDSYDYFWKSYHTKPVQRMFYMGYVKSYKLHYHISSNANGKKNKDKYVRTLKSKGDEVD